MKHSLKWNRNKTTRNNFLTYGVVILVYIIIQIMIGADSISSTMEGLLVPICAYVVMALSLNLTVGVLGELSLGHAGFMSVGAFTGVTAAVALGRNVSSGPVLLIVGMVVGALFAALVGFLIGIPVLRLKGDYLAIVTLAFGEIIKGIFNNLYVGVDSSGLHVSLLSDTTNLAEDGDLVIGGPMGLSGIPRESTFTAGVILIILPLIVIFHLVNSRSGRAIMAVRDNRIAAESIGINITKYKLMAFTVSAALAGAAGTLFAMNNTIENAIENKADNIIFNPEDSTIQLSANGVPVGDKIVVNTNTGAVVTNAGISSDNELILTFNDGTVKNLGSVMGKDGAVYVPHISERKVLTFTIEDEPGEIPEPVDLNPNDEWSEIEGDEVVSDYIWEPM